jgi:hypothetical protein
MSLGFYVRFSVLLKVRIPKKYSTSIWNTTTGNLTHSTYNRYSKDYPATLALPGSSVASGSLSPVTFSKRSDGFFIGSAISTQLLSAYSSCNTLSKVILYGFDL